MSPVGQSGVQTLTSRECWEGDGSTRWERDPHTVKTYTGHTFTTSTDERKIPKGKLRIKTKANQLKKSWLQNNSLSTKHGLNQERRRQQNVTASETVQFQIFLIS